MSNSAVFGAHALEMLRQGLAVLPVGPDRHPYVAGFGRWRSRPGGAAVSRWAEQHPDANIAVLPGLCGGGATVFDCDSADAVDEVQDRFGKSDLQVVTSRGRHLYYDQVPCRMPGNLRRFGIDVDIRAGRQLVIAPPSVHKSGHVYRLDACDWGALKHLRKLDIEALRAFTGKKPLTPANDGLAVSEGQRATTLNNTLVKHAFDCPDRDGLLDLAHTVNGNFTPPLERAEVGKIATKVWCDKADGKIEEWQGIASRRKRSRIGEDGAVRMVDAFVDALDLGELGFDGVVPQETGRPSYHPATNLKIYVYCLAQS